MMRIKITNELKIEILLTLKNGYFEVLKNSQLCTIFEVFYEFNEVFKRPQKTKISKDCKVELLQWLKKGYVETENSVFAKEVKHPTFLEIMIASSQVEDE